MAEGREDLDEPDRVDLRLDPVASSTAASSTAPRRSPSSPSTLERVCIDTVEGGQMTKDLALLISKDAPWLTTDEFMNALDENLARKLGV